MLHADYFFPTVGLLFRPGEASMPDHGTVLMMPDWAARLALLNARSRFPRNYPEKSRP
jgi:hypothetical protein